MTREEMKEFVQYAYDHPDDYTCWTMVRYFEDLLKKEDD